MVKIVLSLESWWKHESAKVLPRVSPWWKVEVADAL